MRTFLTLLDPETIVPGRRLRFSTRDEAWRLLRRDPWAAADCTACTSRAQHEIEWCGNRGRSYSSSARGRITGIFS